MGNTEETADGGVKVKLKFPIKFGEDTITEVTVRRPKGKDLKGLHNLKESHDDQMKLIARLIDHPLKVVEEMDMGTDLQAVGDAALAFLPDGQ